jgi:hypothetical protein
MSEIAELELVPQQNAVAEKTFENQAEYDAFWQRLLEEVDPKLRKLAAARRSSEEAAKRRRII